jgi:hypothetical protein
MVDADPAMGGTVWIAEDVDLEDPLLLTGRFSGYLDQDERSAETFEGLEAEDAIGWGRARAATVLIRTGDSGRYFSVGEHNPDPGKFPDWSPAELRLERRRPRGFEALDNSESDAPIFWDIRVEADLGQPLEVGSFYDRIRTHPAVRSPQTPAPGYPALSAAFLLEASSRKQAAEVADDILQEALATLTAGLPNSHAGGWTSGAEVYPHRPGKPVKGPGISD